MRLTQIKEKVGSLERQLERDVAQSSARGFYQQGIIADDVDDEDNDDRELEISSLVALDLTYEDDAEGADVIDLGVQVGRMRITERIGGLNRPRLSEEVGPVSLNAALLNSSPVSTYRLHKKNLSSFPV
jgi:hypothetical protein